MAGKTEAKTGVKVSQAKEPQESPEAKRDK